MKLIWTLLLGSLLAGANDMDKVWEKRNREYFKAMERVRRADLARSELLTAWDMECKTTGLSLGVDPTGYWRCVVPQGNRAPAAASAPPATAPAKPQ